MRPLSEIRNELKEIRKENDELNKKFELYLKQTKIQNSQKENK